MVSRKVSGWMADSAVFGAARRVYQRNAEDWNLPLSKLDKLMVGIYLILKDYSRGLFPPQPGDRAAMHDRETRYLETIPGVPLAESLDTIRRKPFWSATAFAKYAREFACLLRLLERLGIRKGSRLLELGCGPGWMGEFLANSGFHVTGTSIAPIEVEAARKRAESLGVKGIPETLNFLVCPMEEADRAVEQGAFDVVFVYEALHHAFDWRAALHSAHRCLKPGGWFVLANEPNVLHTFISYRVSRLSNTQEIGMSRRELVRELRRCPFAEVKILGPRLDNRFTAHWIAARK